MQADFAKEILISCMEQRIPTAYGNAKENGGSYQSGRSGSCSKSKNKEKGRNSIPSLYFIFTRFENICYDIFRRQ